jgi:hypothetical protein
MLFVRQLAPPSIHLHRSVVITLDGASYRLRNHTAASDELRRITTGTNLR